MTAVSKVELTNCVGIPTLFNSTTAPFMKLDPVTVIVSEPAFADNRDGVVAGEIVDNTGIGLLTITLSAFDGPTVGEGFTTVTVSTFGRASSSLAIATRRVVALSKVDARATPLMKTVAPGR